MCPVTLFVEVSMTDMPHKGDVVVGGPESMTQTWLPSGVAAGRLAELVMTNGLDAAGLRYADGRYITVR